MNAKQLAGERATEWIQSGMKVGLGTGSTAYYAILKLGELVRSGLDIVGVPTSIGTETLAREQGIPLLGLDEVKRLDVTIDGADEFNPGLDVIKGGGGALYREKVIASITDNFIIVADESKYSDFLGSFPLPVEVVPFGWEITEMRLQKMGAKVRLRKKEGTIYMTDNGNYIFDCEFGQIKNPSDLHLKLKSQIGVVETGLFPNMVRQLIMGTQNGKVKVWDK